MLRELDHIPAGVLVCFSEIALPTLHFKTYQTYQRKEENE